MSPLDRVLGALDRPKRSGRGWMARCPAHDDRVASLSVHEADDGRVLLHCHAGCSTEAVLAKIGLAFRDLSRDANGSRQGSEIVGRYGYVDDDGELLFEVVRLVPKGFRQRRPDGRGGWIWNLDGVRRVLYRLPAVRDAVARDRWVVVVEGERDVHSLERHGFVATTCPGGAGKWRPEFTEVLSGAKVAVLADNDEPGRAHARQVADELVGVAAAVRVVELPGLDEHGDVTDWLSAGGDAAALRRLIVDAPAWGQQDATIAGRDDALASVLERAASDEPERPAAAWDGAALLDDVARFLSRFVAFDAALRAEQRDAVALWAAHSHAIDAADATPRLSIRSPERRSGKTRLLELLGLLVREPLVVAHVTPAALFRALDAAQLTLLVDEVDAIFGPRRSDGNEDLRALLNAGYSRASSRVLRVEGDRTRHVRQFDAFGAVALAGIGRLPDTLEDRAIVIGLRRRRADEHVERLRRRDVEPVAAELRGRLAAWCDTHVDLLAAARPDLPAELDDRAGDVWEPLLALADLAGGDWPDRARRAAVALRRAAADDDGSLGARLLADIRTCFDDAGVDSLKSGELADRLAAIEGAPWAEWHGRPLSANSLARLLARFGVRPGLHRVGGEVLRGYLRTDFADVWARYLPECVTSVNVLQPQPSKGTGCNTSDACNTFRQQEGAGLDEAARTGRGAPDEDPPAPPTTAATQRGRVAGIAREVLDSDPWLRARVAEIPPGAPDRGLRIAELRAEALRRLKAAAAHDAAVALLEDRLGAVVVDDGRLR